MQPKDESPLWEFSISSLRKLGQRIVREVGIAERFSGEEGLVAEVLEVRGDKSTGEWREVVKLYCSAERCEDCPHGPYVFVCRRTESGGDVVWTYESMSESAG